MKKFLIGCMILICLIAAIIYAGLKNNDILTLFIFSGAIFMIGNFLPSEV